jgi:hypothetical protein
MSVLVCQRPDMSKLSKSSEKLSSNRFQWQTIVRGSFDLQRLFAVVANPHCGVSNPTIMCRCLAKKMPGCLGARTRQKEFWHDEYRTTVF